MKLYTIYENGALRIVKKVNFAETKVFIIDDMKNIYIWRGLKASENKRKYGLLKAENINKKRKNSAKIQVLDQNQEYGSFLSIMNILRRGLEQTEDIERRDELVLEVDDTLELIDAGLEPDLEAELTLAAHELSQKNKPYKELCKMLAKLQLSIVIGKKAPTKRELEKKTEEIFKSSSTYEELCWLIVNLNKIKEKQ